MLKHEHIALLNFKSHLKVAYKCNLTYSYYYLLIKLECFNYSENVNARVVQAMFGVIDFMNFISLKDT